MTGEKIRVLEARITNCMKCERLVKFRKEVAGRNTRYSQEDYWSRPVPGYGDIEGKILILGLAPAATGGNRTGRVFTGDKSSDFLVSCLHEAGIANQPTSLSRDDGLVYHDSYISAILKCVPPNDKPERTEIENCYTFLEEEIFLMRNLKVVLTLGTVAHNGLLRYLKRNGIDTRGRKFGHGVVHNFENFKEVCSYHPSPRNVNTGRLSRDSFMKVLELLKNEAST